MIRIAMTLAFVISSLSSANADLNPGLISDFEDGTLQGWEPKHMNTVNESDGPTGNFLRVSPAPRLAAFTTSVSGMVSPDVTEIAVDLMRPSGESDLDMRLVMFGPSTSDRWTSTVAQNLAGDGIWRNFSFSVLESDLTRVLGSGSYGDLTSDLDRLMLRWDEGAPNARGTNGGSGTFAIDNVTAISAPTLDPCDLNGDGVCDAADVDVMTQRVKDGMATIEDRVNFVEGPKPENLFTYVGDWDSSDQFDEQDIVAAFIVGEYLTGNSVGFSGGDADGDFLFTEQDIVFAFIQGGYLQGPRGAAAALPEPSSLVLLALGSLVALIDRRRRSL